jgi:tetratricopeptide (TPR) repeat protein
LAEQTLQRNLTPAEVSTFWTDRAIAFVTSQPGAWLKLMARKFVLLGNATEMVDTEDQASYADWSAPLRLLGPFMHFGVLVPLAFIGILSAWKDRSRVGILLVLLIAYSASVLLFYVFARYRYPLVPLLVLFASAAVANVGAGFTPALAPTGASSSDQGRTHVRPRRRKAGAYIRAVQITVVVAVAIFANWPIASVNAMRAVTDTNLGTAFQTEHRLDDAIAQYRRALANDPGYAPAYSNLATALREQKRTDEALANYHQALRLQPEFAAAHYNLANLLLEQGNAAGAVDQYEHAIRHEAASADIHNNYGIALLSVGRIDDALQEFRQAANLDPGSAKAYRNLGDALSSQGRPAEALAALHRAADLDPNDASTHYDLASTLLEAGNLDEAIPEFRATLRLAPAQAAAHNNLGIALGSQGRLDEAIDEFRRALDAEPGFADAQRNLTMAVAAKRAGLK